MPTRPAGYVAGRCSVRWFGMWTQPDPVIAAKTELAVLAGCETTSHPSAPWLIVD